MALINPLRGVRGLLRDDRMLAVLLPQAERLRVLDTILATKLPGPLARACRAVAVDAGVLRVDCANGAAAARLRSLSGTIGRALAAAGEPVSAVKVRVRADWSRPQRPPKVPLGPAALEAWKQLGSGLPAGELKQAVERLLRHQRDA